MGRSPKVNFVSGCEAKRAMNEREEGWGEAKINPWSGGGGAKKKRGELEGNWAGEIN